MTEGKWLPWNWRKGKMPAMREEGNPFMALQKHVNSIFEDFMSGFGLEPFGEGEFTPRVNVSEDETRIHVTAELPGLDDKDIEVTLTKDSLSIRGEKKEEHEEKSDRSRYYTERRYGYFQRTIPLHCEVDEDKVDAVFKKGVLNITLNKTAEARRQSKKIPVRQ